MTAPSNLTRLLRALAPVLLAGFFALAGSAGPGMAQDARTFAQAGAPTAPAPAARPAFLPPRTAAAPVAEQSGLLTGAWRWLFQKQAEFHRGLIDAVKGLKAGGLWRLEFNPAEAIVGGSLRVISGDVVLLGPASATFRLSGQPGERIVFTFVKR